MTDRPDEKKVPAFVLRFAKVPQALALLDRHPEGMLIDELARRVDADPEDLRTDLHLFLDAREGFFRDQALEFLTDDDDAEYVQLTTTEAAQELGVDYLTAAQLADLYVAGHELLDVEPANDVLRRSLAKLAEVLVPPEVLGAGESQGRGHVPALRDALAQRRKVRIEYSRAWRAGVGVRVVEPYALLRTQLGWELDAGPVQQNRNIRTFLVANIRLLEVLPDTFELPRDANALRARNRALRDATLELPPGSDWVVERFAERWELLSDDAGRKRIRVWVAQPVDDRVGVMILIAGAGARVIAPAYRRAADARLGARLRRRYLGGS